MKELPAYVSTYTDRNGHKRYRFYRRGFPQRSLPKIDDPEFWSAYAAALAQESFKPKGLPPAKPHTFAAAIDKYYQTAEYLSTEPITQKSYRSPLEQIREAIGSIPVADYTMDHAERMMSNNVHRPARANKRLKYIRKILRWCVAWEWIDKDPTFKVKKLKVKDGGFKDWGDEKAARYEAFWEIGTKERLAYDLLVYTGQRRKNIPKMHKTHRKDGRIRVIQAKTNKELWITEHPNLTLSIEAYAANEEEPKGMFLFQTEYGRPYTTDGFGNWFLKCCQKAGIEKGFTAHGLRKLACRRLAEADCTVFQIKAISGHSSTKELEKYVEAANQKKLADQAIAKLTKNGTKTECCDPLD